MVAFWLHSVNKHGPAQNLKTKCSRPIPDPGPFLVLYKKAQAGDPDVMENLPTHQDIANMINTSRETVTRALLTLVQQDIVQKDTHRLIIRDPKALQKLVEG